MAGRSILLVADDHYSSADSVPLEVRGILGSDDNVFVIAPLIGSRISVATDDEALYRAADHRAKHVVNNLSAIGVAATGLRAASGPRDAIMTAMLEHRFDLVVLGVSERGNWREAGLVQWARDAVDVPVIEVVIAENT